MANTVKTIMQKYVEFIPESSCWWWGGSITKAGYGKVSLNGKLTSPHRLFCEHYKGEIPIGIFVLHKCDNRLCVNPDHLFLGTHQDNMNDMKIKKRQRCGNIKLSESQARYIKQNKSMLSRRELSKMFNVTKANIDYIVTGKTWRHI